MHNSALPNKSIGTLLKNFISFLFKENEQELLKLLKNFISCCLTQVKEKLTTLRREEKCLGLAVVDDHDVAVAAVVIFEVLLVVVDTVVIAAVVITAPLIVVGQDEFVVKLR